MLRTCFSDTLLMRNTMIGCERTMDKSSRDCFLESPFQLHPIIRKIGGTSLQKVLFVKPRQIGKILSVRL